MEAGWCTLYHLLVDRGSLAKYVHVLPDLLLFYAVRRRDVLQAIQRHLRRWAHLGGSTSAAVSIACLIGPGDAKGAFDKAPNPLLHRRSRALRLGQCDAFISHSWHDEAG